jgi:nitric oxide dioxygenase
MLTDSQKSLIQQTFDQIFPQADGVAATFYVRLFDIAPHTRALFNPDVRRQGHALMGRLSAAVRPFICPSAGSRCSGGLCREDYMTMGAALLWTLERELGAAFTAEAREAWAAVYAHLADSAANLYDPQFV